MLQARSKISQKSALLSFHMVSCVASWLLRISATGEGAHDVAIDSGNVFPARAVRNSGVVEIIFTTWRALWYLFHCIPQKEPYISAFELYLSAQGLCISAKEPYAIVTSVFPVFPARAGRDNASWKSSLLRDVPFGMYSTVFPKRALHFCRRALPFGTRALHFRKRTPCISQTFPPARAGREIGVMNHLYIGVMEVMFTLVEVMFTLAWWSVFAQ